MPSFRVGSIGGIPIKLGLSFLLVLPLLAWLIASQVGQLVTLGGGAEVFTRNTVGRI